MKKDNKGFSLVELIIVIAIMAILVGIVGSQVLPYLNKSREAKDQQILSGYVTAALSAYSANAAELTGTSYTISVTTSTGGVAVTNDTSTNTLKKAFEELAAPKANPFASTLYKTISQVDLVVTPGGAGTNKDIVYISSFGSGSAANGSISTAELVAK